MNPKRHKTGQKYNATVRRRVEQLLTRGLSQREVRRLLASELGGRAPSAGWLASVAKGRRRPSAATEPSAPARAPDDAPSDLDALIAELDGAATEARRAGAHVLYATLRRLHLAAVALRAKLTPPEPDKDGVYVAGADMRATAAAAREKLADLVTRALERRDAAPRCPNCQQPLPEAST